MTLEQFEHQGSLWTAVVQPVASPDVESGMEVVFIAKDDGEKYAWPLETHLLEAVAEGGVTLDHHRLRIMLRRAIGEERRPTRDPDHAEDEGIVARVRKLLE